ncbi:MAG: SMC family ATPase, partial [Asgard group archaeon]|nr:SMC family ATPase [Asgard group archaeon]
MNNFEVTKISLENIKSYIYKEIPFVNGNNVIIGENGAGKSTILESIYLALFGETLSKKYLADMIRFGEKQGKITLHFTLNDLKYRIEDEIIRRDEHRANQYPVLYNESIEETIAEGKMAVKAKIEEILNIDSNTFLSAVYATQGEIGEIITTSSNDRKKLFDKLFQIEKYESAYKNLRKMINKIEQVIKLLNTKMTAQKEDIKRLPSIKEILTKQQNALKKSKEDLKNLQNQYEEISKKYQLLKKLMKKHTSLIATIEQLKKYIKSLETEKENFLLHITELLENNVEDSFSIKKIQNIHSRIKKDIKKNKEELNSTTKKLEKLRLNLQDLQNLEKECNSVQKQIKGLKNDIQESKDKYLNLIPSLPEDLTIWQRKINTLIEEKHKLLNEKEKTEKEIIEMERTHDKLYLKIEDINEHLSKNNMKSVKTRFQIAKAAGDNWDKLIDNLLKAKIKDELAALKEKITAIQEKSEETRNKTAKISSQLSKIKENIQHLKNLEEGET